MPCGLLYGRLWRYLHKFNSISAFFFHLDRVSPHVWDDIHMVGLSLYRGCPRNINNNFYGVFLRNFSRDESLNHDRRFLGTGHCFYGLSLQLAIPFAKRIRLNNNPVAGLDGRRCSILRCYAHFCHDRNIVAGNGLAIDDLVCNRLRRNDLVCNRLRRNRLGHIKSRHGNLFYSRRIIYMPCGWLNGLL